MYMYMNSSKPTSIDAVGTGLNAMDEVGEWEFLFQMRIMF